MIQFNLLPDVKLAYVKATRTKHIVVVAATATAAGTLAIMLLLLLSVKVAQARHITDLNNKISSTTTQLKNTPNLNQVLTIQNQLSVLTGLHNQKPVLSRLPGFISELTPASATISQIIVSFSTNTFTITGTADSLATINQYIDTMKFSTFKTASSSATPDAFTHVVLTSFGYSTSSGATYQITATFNPALFSAASNVTLNVPTLVTTRSELDQPKALFQPQSSSSSSTPSSSTSTTTNNTTNSSSTNTPTN